MPSSSLGTAGGSAAAKTWTYWLSRGSVALAVVCVAWAVIQRLTGFYVLAAAHLLLLAIAALVFALWIEIALPRSSGSGPE